MLDRRAFLSTISLPAGAAMLGLATALPDPARAAGIARDLASHPGDAKSLAGDDDFWAEVGLAFTVDRSLVNLNNGGVSPSPAFVQEAMKRHLDFSNTCPPHALWTVLEPQREGVRERLGLAWGVSPEEIAVTRNASESLQICQLGFNLKPGDEVLANTQDYPRMITTFQQRERREGIKLVQLQVPIPMTDPAALVEQYDAAITKRTKLLLVSHVINITGQIMPVKELCALGRRRGVPVIVDGAHSFAHLHFALPELDCDYFATSLHKWLFAPHGTGLLYVRRDKIDGLWPMMAAPASMDGNIRKFEEIGTHPAANFLAIGEALTFHHGIGGARKEARLRHLRDTWAQRLLAHPSGRVRLHTSLDPRFSCGIATVEVDGLDTAKLSDWLWKSHRILTVAILHPEFNGLRVTPSVYTTMEELDRFCLAMETALRDGLPA